MYRILLSGLLSYLIPTILIAQAGLVENQVPSPNATSFMKYIDNPVSLHSGTAQIEIPVFEVKSGSLSLPISLSYHASGIKPDEFPSWVGMGWSLNAGGVITRKVNNLPDDLYLDMNPYSGYIGMYKCSSPGSPEQWESFRNPFNSNDEWEGFDYSELPTDLATDEYYFNFGHFSGKFVLSNEWDSQNECRKFIAIGHPELKIEAWGTPHRTVFPNIQLNCQQRDIQYELYQLKNYYKGFRITTPDGVRYDFGADYNLSPSDVGACDVSIPYWSNEEFWVNANIESWYLLRVSKANSSETITFEYSRKSPILNLFEACKFEASHLDGTFNPENYFGTGSGNKRLNPGYRSNDLLAEVGYITYDIIGNIISPIYLSRISFVNGNICFDMEVAKDLEYDSDLLKTAFKLNERAYEGSNKCLINSFWLHNNHIQKLKKIEVKNSQDLIIKSFTFDYCNFEHERLRLCKFSEDGVNPYIFSYTGYELTSQTDENWPYAENIPPLPSYLSNMTDHKGFLTDETGNKRYLLDKLRIKAKGINEDDLGQVYYPLTNNQSQYLIDGSFGGDKEFWTGFFSAGFQEINYTDAVISGTLGKVEYPTGGYTCYTYEPNYADSVVLSKANAAKDKDTIVSYNKYAGGIRIKNISNYEQNGTKNSSTTYQYELGVLNGLPEFYSQAYFKEVMEPLDAHLIIDQFSSNNQVPLSSTNTVSPVTYSKITQIAEGIEEVSSDHSIIYYYRNFEDHQDLYTQEQINNHENLHLDSPSIPIGNTTRIGSLITGCEFNRGQILAKIYMNQDDATVKKEYFNYTIHEYGDSIPIYENIIITNSLITQKESANIGPVFAYELAQIVPFRLDLTKNTIINYFENDSVIEDIEYEYHEYWGIPIREKYYCNNESINEVKYNRIYNGIVDEENLPEELRITQQMYYKNLLELPVEIKYYKYINNERYLVKGEYFEYGNFGSIGNSDSLYFPKSRYSLNLVVPIEAPNPVYDVNFYEYFEENNSLFPTLEKEIEYLTYDVNGNCLEHNIKGITHSTKFLYNSSLPVIQASNIDYNGLNSSINSAGNKPPYLNLNELIAYAGTNNNPQDSLNIFSVNLAQESLMENAGFMVYTYDPLIGIKSQTDHNANTTLYQYDNNARLEKIFDNNNSILKQYVYNFQNSYSENIEAEISSSMTNQSLPQAIHSLKASITPSYPIKSYSWSVVNGQIIGASNEQNCRIKVGCFGQTTSVTCEIVLINDSTVIASRQTSVDMSYNISGDTNTVINSIFGYKLNGEDFSGVSFLWSVDDGEIKSDNDTSFVMIEMPGYCTTTTLRCTVYYCNDSTIYTKQLNVKGTAFQIFNRSKVFFDDTLNYYVHYLIDEPSGINYQWTLDGPADIIGSDTSKNISINFNDVGFADINCTINQPECDPEVVSFTERIDLNGYLVYLPIINLYTINWENNPSSVKWQLFEKQPDSTYNQISEYIITQTRGDCQGTYDWYQKYNWGSCQSCDEYETDGEHFSYYLDEDPCITFTDNHEYRISCVITVGSSTINANPSYFLYDGGEYIEQIPE